MSAEPCLCGDPECPRCFPRSEALPVKRYKCTFIGRRVGALGVRHRITLTVDAWTEADAKFACYEEHEHISSWTAEEIRDA
jgi:hypothetical protein